MTPARRSTVSIGLAFSAAALFCAAVCAATIEIYPPLAGNAYQSTLYQVEVFDGSSWQSAYAYGFSRLCVTYWHTGTSPAVNFLTFGTTGPVDVRVSKIVGSITSIDVSRHSKNIPVVLTGKTRANNVILPVGGSGEIVVRCGQASGTVEFVLDVNGYLQ